MKRVAIQSFFSILEEFLFVALSTPVCIRITTNTGDVNDSRNRTSDWHHPGIAVLFWRIDLHQFTTNYRWRLLESIVTSTRMAITFFYRQIDSKCRRYPLADEGWSHLSPAHTSNLPASHLFKRRRKKKVAILAELYISIILYLSCSICCLVQTRFPSNMEAYWKRTSELLLFI